LKLRNVLCALSSPVFCLAAARGAEKPSAWLDFFAFDSLRGTLARDHQPRAVFHEGAHRRTYFTYMDHEFDARVVAYDLDKETWSDVVRVDDCRTRDGHNAPAILAARDGTLHLFYGCHGHPVKYARSSRPEDITEWETGMEIGSHATYTYAVQRKNGDLLLFYRFGGAGRRSPLKVHCSKDAGDTWDDEKVILDYGDGSWVKIRDTLYDRQRDLVHLALWEGNMKYWNAFYAAYDPSKGRVLALDGADLGPSADKEALLAHGSGVVHSNARADLDLFLCEGKPFFILADPPGKRVFFAHWDEDRLSRTEIPKALMKGLTQFELYAENQTLFHLYGLCRTEPATSFSGNDLVVWKSSDQGRTWSEPEVIVDRRRLQHGLTGLNLTENYPGEGPLVWTQEEWLERSENLPRHRGSILDDAAFRFNKRLYALDNHYRFVRRDASAP